MAGETKHGMGCAEFEALLCEAVEGQLSAAHKLRFDAHRRDCAVCGPLFADALAGRKLLWSLGTVEPPAHLVHNILIATSGVVSKRAMKATAADGGRTPLGEQAREWWDSFAASFFTPAMAFVRQPRFAMSFGMIFFSLSLILNFAGFKASDLARINLRPSAVRHAYNEAQVKVVHYYDNIRFVYEIESKLRELKRANTPAEPGAVEEKENRKNNTTEQQEQKQDRNYSRENSQMVLAAITGGPNEVRSGQLRASSCEQTEGRSWLAARSSKPRVVTVIINGRYV